MDEKIKDIIKESPVKEDKVILTKEQEIQVLEIWNSSPPEKPPTLQEIIDKIFSGKEPRDKWGMAIRKFIASRDLKLTKIRDREKKNFTLNEEQKKYIEDNADIRLPYEMGRVLFGEDIEPASIQVRQVAAYIKTLKGYVPPANSGPKPVSNYSPPRSIESLCRKVNDYANPVKKLDSEKLTPTELKGLTACLGYVNNKRLVYQMRSYVTEDEKILCESTFIKYTYDKPDLTQEEVDQYILMATEAVIAYNALKTASMLQSEQENLVNNGERMSMSLIDSITDARKYYDDSVSRQRKLYDALTQKRSERMSKQLKDNATILNLVNFVKDRENRRKLVEYTKMKEEKLRDEVKKYIDMSELKSRFLGIGIEEIING